MFLYDLAFLVVIAVLVLASRRSWALAMPAVLVAVAFYAVSIRGLPIPYRFSSLFGQEFVVHGMYEYAGATFLLVSPEGGPPIHVVLQLSKEQQARAEGAAGKAEEEGKPLLLKPGSGLSNDPQFYIFEAPGLPSKD